MADDGGVSHRRSLWWIAALVLTAASSGASFVAADRAAASSASAHERADAIRLVQLRSSLRRVHLEEVDLMALEVFGLATPTDVQTARATREGTRALAIAELRVMSHGSGSNAVEAGALASLLTDDEVVDGEVEPLVLFDAGRAAVRDGRPLDGETPTDVERLYDVMRLDSIGRQILNDGLDASYVTSTPPVPDIMVDYFAESAPYLGDSGGYLGAQVKLSDKFRFGGSVEQVQETQNGDTTVQRTGNCGDLYFDYKITSNWSLRGSGGYCGYQDQQGGTDTNRDGVTLGLDVLWQFRY